VSEQWTRVVALKCERSERTGFQVASKNLVQKGQELRSGFDIWKGGEPQSGLLSMLLETRLPVWVPENTRCTRGEEGLFLA